MWLGTKPVAQLTAKKRDITDAEEQDNQTPHQAPWHWEPVLGRLVPIMSGYENYQGLTLGESKSDRKPSSCP